MADFKFYMFFVWVAAMTLACWSFEVARMFARRMKKQATGPGSAAGDLRTTMVVPARQPRVAVILPIKGVDADMRENIAALRAQDYPHYRLLFAVESPDDPVLPLLREFAEHAKRTGGAVMDIAIAGVATQRGQKIHNQLAAIERTTDADEIMVFMDADARPAPDWLSELVQPLIVPSPGKGKPTGATTGFRFYVPEHPREKLPDTFVSIINAAVAALLGPGWRCIAWGGSMAIRRSDFFAFGVHDAWQHALSDDYVLSWCVQKKAKRRIQFVQACLVASAADFSWPGFWEFAVRQYKDHPDLRLAGVWIAARSLLATFLPRCGFAYHIFILASECRWRRADIITHRPRRPSPACHVPGAVYRQRLARLASPAGRHQWTAGTSRKTPSTGFLVFAGLPGIHRRELGRSAQILVW